MLLKEVSEHNHWPMTKIVAVNSDAKGTAETFAALEY